MKKKVFIITTAVLAAIIIGVYLNRAYTLIYSKFNLTAAPAEREYMTEKTLTEKSNLVTYAAIGDSLTAGVGASSVSSTFPALLAEKISAQKDMMVKVKNLGTPGATSFDLLTGQVLDAAQYDPQIITLFIGVNDIHNFVPLEKYKSNLKTAIGALQRSTKAKIYLLNLPYLGARDLVLPPYDLYYDMKTREYNDVIKEVAGETGVTLIDLYAAADKPFKQDQSLYSIDRYHPSDSGYEMWVNNIYVQFE